MWILGPRTEEGNDAEALRNWGANYGGVVDIRHLSGLPALEGRFLSQATAKPASMLDTFDEPRVRKVERPSQ
jgi:hypothetical protein